MTTAARVDYASTFRRLYDQTIGDAIAAAADVLLTPPPVAPPPPLPSDVSPEPVLSDPLADARVLYGNAILPFGLDAIDYDTLLAMSGELVRREDFPRGTVSQLVQHPPESVVIVDPLGNVVELPQFIPEFLPPPPPVGPTLPPVAPIEPTPVLPEEIDMSLLTGLGNFARSNIGQSLLGGVATALTNRLVGVGGSIGPTQLPTTLLRGPQLPALPGVGFTTGGGFGGGAMVPSRTSMMRGGLRNARGRRISATTGKEIRRLNPTNVHALRRSLRRVEGFIKLEKRVDKIVRRMAPARLHRQARSSGFVRSRKR